MGLLPPASMHFPSCTAHRCQPKADWKCFLYICFVTPDPADNLPGGMVDVKDISGQDPEGWRQLSSFLMQIFGGKWVATVLPAQAAAEARKALLYGNTLSCQQVTHYQL